MIDLHSHILPGLDDGASDLAVSLEMARIAVADGIVTMACTPHIFPGVYRNTSAIIKAAVAGLSDALQRAGISLQLTTGADVHAVPNLLGSLRQGIIPTLNESRYFLLEPPHDILPPRFEDLVFLLIAGGYMPVLTHPERLSWIAAHFDVIRRLADGGVLMQLTAGSLTGRFGKEPRYWAERMLAERLVHVIASDAHDLGRRPPRLAHARDIVSERVGEAVANDLVAGNPLRVLENQVRSRFPRTEPTAAGGIQGR